MITDPKLFPRDCITCDAPGCGKPAPAKRCSRCCTAYYCSVECQKLHWIHGQDPHKEHCVPVASLRDREETTGNNNLESPTDITATTNTTIEPLNTECSICLKSPLDPPTTTVFPDCKHGFCTSCIISWQRETKKGHCECCCDCKTPFACPYCRTLATEGNGNIEETLLADLFALAGDCSKKSPEFNQSILARLEPLLEDHSCADLDAFMLKAQLLLVLGRGAETLQVLEDMMTEYERRRNLPITHLMDQADQAREQGDWLVFQDLKQQIAAAYYDETSGPMPHLFGAEERSDILTLKCEAYLVDKQWNNAMNTYLEMSSNVQGNPSPMFMQKVCAGMARCLYHLEAYDRAIVASDAAIRTGRQMPDVHKHKALSQRAMGNLDAAIQTMNQAVLYETPWDEQHMKEVQTLYYELLAERDDVQQECKET